MSITEIGILLILVSLVVIVLCVALFSLLRDVERLDDQMSQRDEQLRNELDALRAANRINIAYWNTRQQMSAEVQRHRQGSSGHVSGRWSR